jgi:oligosaccharide translocation protein RFT1
MRFWSASFLVQLFVRLFSFISSQFLIRLLTLASFGVWSVSLSLVSETLMFWAREGVRKAAARSSTTRFKYALLPFALGVVMFPIVVVGSFRLCPDVAGFRSAVVLTCVGALLELLGEAWSVPQLAAMRSDTVAQVTSFGFLVRSVLVVVLTRFFGLESESRLMLCFGAANLALGIAVVIGFLVKSGKPQIALPTMAELKSLLPFALQTVLQWLFSQGERLVLLISSSPDQIGVYGFVSDLGSLVARIIFAPIETSVFHVCASSERVPVDVLSVATRVVLCVGLSAAAFGPPLAPPVLTALYGAKWSGEDAQGTFAAICRVFPLMALNGITEAVANARLADKRLGLYNLLLAGVTVVYFVLMAGLNWQFGTPGAVYANGVNMGLRSIMALVVVARECGRIGPLFPNAGIVTVFVGIAAAGHALPRLVVVGLVPIVASMVLYFERETIKQLVGSFKKGDLKTD